MNYVLAGAKMKKVSLLVCASLLFNMALVSAETERDIPSYRQEIAEGRDQGVTDFHPSNNKPIPPAAVSPAERFPGTEESNPLLNPGTIPTLSKEVEKNLPPSSYPSMQAPQSGRASFKKGRSQNDMRQKRKEKRRFLKQKGTGKKLLKEKKKLKKTKPRLKTSQKKPPKT